MFCRLRCQSVGTHLYTHTSTLTHTAQKGLQFLMAGSCCRKSPPHLLLSPPTHLASIIPVLVEQPPVTTRSIANKCSHFPLRFRALPPFPHTPATLWPLVRSPGSPVPPPVTNRGAAWPEEEVMVERGVESLAAWASLFSEGGMREKPVSLCRG